uniref:ATP synthase peripheral stalk subunit OSCP, mitochondrial n=1 Tax=Ciona intestinalis TaxID=7719 RepID=F6PZM1_CIOIN|nr:ATP synthase subunit O, mitochondrial [Ciona intestinalis]|eukprot:XP_002127217.1 ATP synthase subunit O, mitochondrial [Ciona intestinalis]
MASSFGLLLRRGLSTSALRCDMVRTPIPTFGLTGCYAQALYSASVKSKTKENVAKDLVTIGGMFQSQKVADFMNDPFIKSDIKLGLLKEVATKAGMSNTSVNFFGVLAENNRLDLISDVTDIFARLMSAEKGEIPATVTTAQALDAKQKKEVETALAKFVNKNEKIILTEKVDPSLLGGMVVNIGDKFTDMKYIDMSTSSKIKTYLELIKQPV